MTKFAAAIACVAVLGMPMASSAQSADQVIGGVLGIIGGPQKASQVEGPQGGQTQPQLPVKAEPSTAATPPGSLNASQVSEKTIEKFFSMAPAGGCTYKKDGTNVSVFIVDLSGPAVIGLNGREIELKNVMKNNQQSDAYIANDGTKVSIIDRKNGPMREESFKVTAKLSIVSGSSNISVKVNGLCSVG
jgi:hypothetical protein